MTLAAQLRDPIEVRLSRAESTISAAPRGGSPLAVALALESLRPARGLAEFIGKPPSSTSPLAMNHTTNGERVSRLLLAARQLSSQEEVVPEVATRVLHAVMLTHLEECGDNQTAAILASDRRRALEGAGLWTGLAAVSILIVETRELYLNELFEGTSYSPDRRDEITAKMLEAAAMMPRGTPIPQSRAIHADFLDAATRTYIYEFWLGTGDHAFRDYVATLVTALGSAARPDNYVTLALNTRRSQPGLGR